MADNRMWEVWGRTNALYTAWCASHGVNVYRQLVLYAINAHAPITQREIADCTGLSRQTVSTVMRALKDEGYVSLCEGETDRREKSVRFTPEGQAYVDEILAPLYAIEARVFEMMGAERMKQLSDSIDLFNLIFEKEMETQNHASGKK